MMLLWRICSRVLGVVYILLKWLEIWVETQMLGKTYIQSISISIYLYRVCDMNWST